ncbi:hypothetical protein GON09_005037 [Rhodococcus sp. B50]|nr:hypothetical protein [Rhodococcus sp. B50]
MTHDHSALLAQLDALKGADSASVFAELIRTGLQALIEAEATDKLGAGRYERTDTRTTHRNGHRTKTVATTSGDVEVKIPKLRSGSFFPSLLERRRRIDKALYAVVMEAYVHGVSTRSVDDLVGALGVGSGISKSEVSRICAGLDAEITRFRERTAGAHELSVCVPRRHLLQGPGRGARGLPSTGGRDGGVDRRHPRGVGHRGR